MSAASTPPYCLLATEKRFSGAELAAEMWHAKNANMRARYSYLAGGGEPTHAYFWSQYDAKDEAFARFAKLPHASDSDYE